MNILQYQPEDDISSQLNIEKSLDTATIHVRIIKRNGRKFWTIIEGLEEIEGLDKLKFLEKAKGNCGIDKLCTVMKNKLAVGGAVKVDTKTSSASKVIQLQGNCKDDVKSFLLDNKVIEEDNMKFHGS